MITGFSTGCLYKLDINVYQRIKLYSQLGADALEIMFNDSNQLENFQTSKEIVSDIEKYKFVSLHAPNDKNSKYNFSLQSKKMIEKLKFLCETFEVSGIVFHPNTIESLSVLERSGLPILLENMDIRNHIGIDPEYFEKIKNNYDFGFVLDFQHVFENDPLMESVKDFIQVMGDKLRHIHLSGQTDFSNHYPSSLAANREEIKKSFSAKIQVPIILEGVLEKDMSKDVSKILLRELEFVGSFEK
ncbi:hypothetical protein KAJ41_01245 [Candidatus Parcubacteria bacterium]|nr:hypothetical protein [Candidatus Parcubacteria bacterium]